MTSPRALSLIPSAAATAALVMTLGVSGASAGAGASLHGTVSHLTLHNGATDELDGVTVRLYDRTGKLIDLAAVDPASGAYAFEDEPAGAYKLGLQFNSRNLLQGQSFGANDVSYFYSTTGPTAVWSKASSIALTDGGSSTLDLRAISGERIRGTLIGEWINGPELNISARSAAPKDANTIGGSAFARMGAIKRLKGNRLEFTFETTSILPGEYRLWSPTLWGKHETLYYTGDGRKGSPAAARGAVITAKKRTGSVAIGVFDARN